jgi:hypothetical protein
VFAARVNALIHRSAWKFNSQKLVCRMVHSPARWPPYGRPESSRLLKVDHNVLHVRIKMRLDECAASSQNTDADTGVGAGVMAPVHDERYGLPDMDVCISCLNGCSMGLGPRGRRGLTPRLQRRSRRLWRAMVEVGRSGAPRRTIFCRNVRQNSARIARTVFNVAVCRTF